MIAMQHVFVWTVGDVIGLGALALMAILFVIGLVIAKVGGK